MAAFRNTQLDLSTIRGLRKVDTVCYPKKVATKDARRSGMAEPLQLWEGRRKVMSITNGIQTAFDDTPERDAYRTVLALRVLFHNFTHMCEPTRHVQRLAFDVMENDIYELISMLRLDIEEMINRGEIR